MVSTTRSGVSATRGRPPTKICSTWRHVKPVLPCRLTPLFFHFRKRPFVLGSPCLERHVCLGCPAAHAARPGLRFNFVRPARPVLAKLFRHAANTEREFVIRFERDSKFVRKRRAEIGPYHFLRLEQRSKVNRPIAPVRPTRHVQRQAMAVKLRILAPGLAMNKFRHEQINVLPVVTALPTPRLAEFIAHVPERLVDRPIERRLNQAALVGVAYRPERDTSFGTLRQRSMAALRSALPWFWARASPVFGW